jgi:hypothetical protein
VHGYRRIKIGDDRFIGTEILLPTALRTVAWAIGRVGHGQAKRLLQTWLNHEDVTVRSAALAALLHLKEYKLIQETMSQNTQTETPWSTLAAGASRSEATLLLTQVAREKPKADSLVALGIMGDMAAVPVLLAHLSDEELAGSAALGLNVLTGAELYEKAFIPEVMDEDELFEDEKEGVKKGQPVLRPDGKPYGENVVRLSQKLTDWQDWWSTNKARFQVGLRYRNGKPLSPSCLVDNLEFEKTPRKVRQLAYEELVVRYGADIPFETDMPIQRQREVIAKWRGWATVNEEHFKSGEWYLGGQLFGKPDQGKP